MKQLLQVSALAGMVSLTACADDDGSEISGLEVEAIAAVIVPGADARPLKLNHHGLVPVWTVSKDQELACGGPAVAGGEVGGRASFTHLGASSVQVSAAWDVGNLIAGPAQYEPVGPAGGPVAPVLGQSGYPYAFHYDPESDSCQPGAVATGKVVLTAANGDRLFGDI
ncbi:MAG TPA: hypothetical protein VMM17_04050, partial [Gemmatimonadaceae bacterium]|nr:hypothetical protein [Gemmatimonadaceae bacterium]